MNTRVNSVYGRTFPCPPRDTRKSDKAAEKERKDIEEGRRIREQHRDDDEEEDASDDRRGEDARARPTS